MVAEMAVSGVEMAAEMAQAQEEVRVISFFVFWFFFCFISTCWVFLIFFCFVSIVLMYEWLNMKIKWNVDRFSGFWKTNGRKNFLQRIYRENIRFTEKINYLSRKSSILPRKCMIYREKVVFNEKRDDLPRLSRI